MPEAPNPLAEPQPPRRAVVLAALAVGVILIIAFGRPVLYWQKQLAFLAVALLIAAIPPARRGVLKLMAKMRTPSPRARALSASLIAVLATVYLLGTGVYQERDWFPKFHDEHMYLLQTQMIARGKLWLPQHELADFFETTHVLVKPVYASIYFPGAALMHAPAVWLDLPYWLIPAILSGGAVALLYRVTTELLDDGLAGVLAALMLVGLMIFRQISLMVMSHTNMVLLGLAVIWAWLRWRRSRRHGWLVVIGALSGWAAITRPIDAVAWVAPLAIALLYDLRGTALRRRALVLAIPVVAALPFLALQVIFNVGVTGDALKTPYAMYLEQFSPQSLWAVEHDAATRPATSLPQKLDYYDEFTLPALQARRLDRLPGAWLRERFPRMALVTLPSTLLLALVPFGVIGLRSPGQAVLATPVFLFVMLYATFAYLLAHYIVVIAPSVILLVVLGRQTLIRAWRNSPFVACASALAIVALTLSSLPELNWYVRDDLYVRPVMYFNHVELPRRVQTPAIVLYRYRSGDNVHEEPVYNVDVARPDDALIIRAHDLGPEKNQQLFRYYAQRQPARTVYRFDRGTRVLTRLGNVTELLR